MGKPAFFIRLFGCPVHCPWCDSAGTWHPTWVPKFVDHFTADELCGEIETNADFVVITGGEPAIHDLTDLVAAIRTKPVHLETSGAFPIKGIDWIDWVTLSPKKWMMPLDENVDLADEFKIIVETPDDIDFYLNDVPKSFNGSIWLHPEWSQHKNPEVLKAICNAVKNRPRPGLRAGWQLHKNYMVDVFDSRSKANVPLGGDLKKGF